LPKTDSTHINYTLCCPELNEKTVASRLRAGADGQQKDTTQKMGSVIASLAATRAVVIAKPPKAAVAISKNDQYGTSGFRRI
jgi:hypothetical protein